MFPTPLKIGVIDANATGISCAVALAQHHEVVLYAENRLAVHQVNAGLSPVDDTTAQRYFEYRDLNLRATFHCHDALRHADLIIITTPTSFIEWAKAVDTSLLDETVRNVQRINPHALTVIESTCPVGYAKARAQELGFENLISAPALVRPKRALKDRLYPSRFVVGEHSERGRAYAQLLQDCSLLPHVPVLLTGSAEAEAIQLFSLRRMVTGEEPTPAQITHYAREHQLNAKHLLQGLDISSLPQLDNPVTTPMPYEPPPISPSPWSDTRPQL